MTPRFILRFWAHLARRNRVNEMPDADCYRDLGQIMARLDEMEKSRLEREAVTEKARIERNAAVDAQLALLNQKMDTINSERQMMTGVVWAVRVLFGGLGATVIYLLANGVPTWIKRALQ